MFDVCFQKQFMHDSVYTVVTMVVLFQVFEKLNDDVGCK